ncbi:Arm DNA-binding domain-containing protein [Bartonella sp. AC90GZZY]|uniref:Arm DNA-binding domain-containing protein n=1 Tax=Bartonella sp. AC90GZZY TaxID=3243461 RepID=UPI0035D04CC5
MALMNHLKYQGLSQQPRAGKNVCYGVGLLLHKRKDGGVQWIYRYTLHGNCREMSLGALRDVSLKQAGKCATQWCSVLQEEHAPY